MLAQDSEFAAFMSTYASTNKTLEHDSSNRKITRLKEDSKAPVRDRHKRPDKQLYVPRALRKTANESIQSEKGKKSVVYSQTDETPQKFSQTVSKTSSESVFLEQKEKQEEVIKTSNSFLNDFPGNECNVPSTQMIDVKTTEEITQSPMQDIAHAENLNTFVTEQEGLTNSKMSCFNAVKHEMNMSAEEKPIELSTKLNGETVGSFKNFSSTEYLKEDLPLPNITRQQQTIPQSNNCSEIVEDSWEAKFNDEGDCLDPKLVKELCDITGRIDMTIAKGDYSDFQPLSTDASKGYDNIVELFGFPVEFSTQDLTSAFSAFQSSSYNIKWVDDSHALAIFSSPVIASQALHLSHPFIKVRPLSEGIKESKEKARYCARMFETHKPRPVTSASLARRLVSGALGLKVNASKEQRDIERNILREAKEKKKLKAKQRQDIWNGIVS